MENTLNSSEATTTQLGHYLAILQQLKDTITMLLMNFMLFFGILFYGIAVPGLVLYVLRWQLVRGKNNWQKAALLWGLGVVHELLCVVLFWSVGAEDDLFECGSYLAYGYMAGVGISLAGFLNAFSHRQHAEQ
ncbi:hypothetical protein MUN84_06500 [Hymenobacter sp. 5516J-16]|uniref:hypothetical protein n=1 Tax=Hymenobacter sp. 5516J-16 TaxID=2932253 RepID=UPI001FCFB3B1|nr:hypothetical protein [Hymenobacter sp. 5516J-16]UOQ78232.1 hypothetical protein MUN84_06500 [Hymenobacter sp. 5516J-16]